MKNFEGSLQKGGTEGEPIDNFHETIAYGAIKFHTEDTENFFLEHRRMCLCNFLSSFRLLFNTFYIRKPYRETFSAFTSFNISVCAFHASARNNEILGKFIFRTTFVLTLKLISS